jgi:hypothetical protein
VITSVRGKFEQGMDFTKDFWDKVATFEGSTCSLDIRDKDNEDLIDRRVIPYTLLATGPDFWGETAFSTADPSFDLREDNPGPVRLAGAVIRGAATRDDIGGEISRMVVIANSDFLAPKYFSDINKDFLASSLNWLIGREDLTGAGPRTLGTYKLPLLDSQLSFINRINLFFLPAFALAIGALVWSSRRACARCTDRLRDGSSSLISSPAVTRESATARSAAFTCPIDRRKPCSMPGKVVASTFTPAARRRASMALFSAARTSRSATCSRQGGRPVRSARKGAARGWRRSASRGA